MHLFCFLISGWAGLHHPELPGQRALARHRLRAELPGQRLWQGRGTRNACVPQGFSAISHVKRLRFAGFLGDFACETLAFCKVFWRYGMQFLLKIIENQRKIGKSENGRSQSKELIKESKNKEQITKKGRELFIILRVLRT